MKSFSPDSLPAPAGHYSPAVQAGEFVFLSGVLPGSCGAGEAEGFERQVRSVLERSRVILASAGCTLADVAQCTAYIVGGEHWPRFNAVYAEALGAHRPARTVVPVAELHHGWLVEIQMVAHRTGAGQERAGRA